MIIWRVWGWLTLVFILLTFGLSSIVNGIYRNATGYDYVFNPQTTINVGIATVIVSVLFALFVVLLLPRLERIPHNGDAMQARIEAQKAEKAAVAGGAAPTPPTPLAKFWKTRSSTFFIPMWVQPVIFLVIGLLMIVLNLGPAAAIPQDQHFDN